MKRTLYIILFLFFSVFISNPAIAAKKELIFAQVTDLRFAPNQTSIENFNKLIKHLNEDKSIKFVAFTGDNIENPNENLLKVFLQMCKKLNTPYYIEIGNHDCFRAAGLSKKRYLELIHKKSFNYYIKKDELVFVFVDGAKEHIPSPNGFYKVETTNWLDKVLTKNENKTIIILQHFPIYDLTPNSIHNTYKTDIYFDILKKHSNILAVISGHYKTNQEKIIDGIYHITTEPAKAGCSSYRKIFI